jgi:hypothetical protein
MYEKYLLLKGIREAKYKVGGKEKKWLAFCLELR